MSSSKNYKGKGKDPEELAFDGAGTQNVPTIDNAHLFTTSNAWTGPPWGQRLEQYKKENVSDYQRKEYNDGMTQVASGSTRHVSIPDSQRGPAAQIQPSLHPSLQQHDPNEQNTALWITGLPPTVTPRELLAQIRGAGKVFSLAILPVRYDRHGNVHARTAAASLAFFSPDGARALIQQQQNQRPLVVGGRMASVRYNNRRGDPCHDEGSRVLIIKGDPQIVRYGFLKVFFATREILYETDRRYYSAVDGESRIEWRFASYLGQARRAYDHLKRTYADRVSVEYGRDPCEAA